MSGPKISVYELERRRREEEARKLAEEFRKEHQSYEESRKKDLERRRNEKGRLQTVIEAGAIRDELSSLRVKFSLFMQDARFMQGYTDVSGIISSIEADVDELNSALKPEDTPSEKEALEYKNKLEKTRDSLKAKLKEYEGEKAKWDRQLGSVLDKALDDIFGGEEAPAAVKASKEKTEAVKTKQEQEAAAIRKDEEKKLSEELLGVLEGKAESVKAMQLQGSEDFAGELSRQSKVMGNLIKLGDYHGAISFYYQKEKENSGADERLREEAERRAERLSDVRTSYEVVCEMAGMEPLKVPDGLDEEDTARWYEEKRIETEAALLEEREKQIICSELGNIMEELGYHVIAEKETVRKSGKHIKENIFSFGEGTAVNITEAGGQITMEVVGLDTSTRMPEEAEQDYLEEEMVSFCSAHKEIEKKLKERGIVLKNRLQLNPPSKEYAKILNVTAYDRKTENISMIQERSKGKKQAAAKAAVQQHLN